MAFWRWIALRIYGPCVPAKNLRNAFEHRAPTPIRNVARAPGLRRRESSRRLVGCDQNSQASVETSLDAARTSARAMLLFGGVVDFHFSYLEACQEQDCDCKQKQAGDGDVGWH